MEVDSVHAVTETGKAQTEVETQQQCVTVIKTARTNSRTTLKLFMPHIL